MPTKVLKLSAQKVLTPRSPIEDGEHPVWASILANRIIIILQKAQLLTISLAKPRVCCRNNKIKDPAIFAYQAANHTKKKTAKPRQITKKKTDHDHHLKKYARQTHDISLKTKQKHTNYYISHKAEALLLALRPPPSSESDPLEASSPDASEAWLPVSASLPCSVGLGKGARFEQSFPSTRMYSTLRQVVWLSRLQVVFDRKSEVELLCLFGVLECPNAWLDWGILKGRISLWVLKIVERNRV